MIISGIDRITKATSHKMLLVAYSSRKPNKFYELKPIDMQLQTDMSWSPYIQLHATCVIEDMDIMDILDVRMNGRVQVHMGYEYEDGYITEPLLFDLYINQTTINFPDGTVEIEAFSDDGRAQETLAFWNGYNLDRSSLVRYVSSLLSQGQLADNKSVASEFAANYGAAIVKDAAPERGDNVWDVIDELQQASNTWIRPESGNMWRIGPRPERTSRATHKLEVGDTGTVITGKMVSSRDNFYNAAYLDYEWDQGGKGEKKMLTERGSSVIYWDPYDVKKIGPKIYYEKINRRATRAQADAAAKAILSRKLTKGTIYEVSALSAYWLRPGDTVTLSLYEGQLETLLVQSINWTHDGLMGLELIKPEVGGKI